MSHGGGKVHSGIWEVGWLSRLLASYLYAIAACLSRLLSRHCCMVDLAFIDIYIERKKMIVLLFVSSHLATGD